MPSWNEMTMLAWTIYISFLGVAVLLALKPDNVRGARIVAMLSAVAGLVVALAGASVYDVNGAPVKVADAAWIPQLGIRYTLVVDGISVTLVVLMERRASNQAILCVLPRAHRRSLWRVPELRFVPPVCVL
jgi:NADH:ubiquinone oxidoreductase subunit 4 (subunit M)